MSIIIIITIIITIITIIVISLFILGKKIYLQYWNTNILFWFHESICTLFLKAFSKWLYL